MIHAVIVEDDPMVAKINRQYLECLGEYRVDKICHSSSEGLAYLRENHADLLILDVIMPGMDGIELLRTLRAERCDVSVIMVTAANDVGTVNASLQLGVIDYLIKPYSFERFREAVQKYAAKTQFLRKSETVDQETMNRLLNNHWTVHSNHRELQKGLGPQTLDAVLSCMLCNPDRLYSCESLSEACGLSKITVRHYLNYLIETGHIVSSVDYETGGRPRVLYKLISD